MKAIKRSGRVKFVSVAFTQLSVLIAEDFKTRLRSRLARKVKQNCRFTIVDVPLRVTDWYIAFEGTWPEADLDRALNGVATELGAEMYMDPAIPFAEMTGDLRDFIRVVNRRRDRRTN